jgi:hypothetical protein
MTCPRGGKGAVVQRPETHGPRADQPYFSRANQPEGRGIKGGTGGRWREG